MLHNWGMALLLTHDDGTIRRKLAEAVPTAREAAVLDAGEHNVGAHVDVEHEDAVTATHLFDALLPGYRGWRWAVTVALPATDPDAEVTVSEVTLLPGPDAILAPRWVPWERRVRHGDLGVGDLFPTREDDPRVVPAYATTDDPEVEDVAHEIGLGRERVMSRHGREETATRWYRGEYGPRSDMARSAPGACGTCAFYLGLAGSLRAAFGVCGNEISPADGHVVHAEFGCGAHSEVEMERRSPVPVAEVVYDDSVLDSDMPQAADTPQAADGADAPTRG